MDLPEKIFGGFSNWLRQRRKDESQSVLLDEEILAVQLFSQAGEHGALILPGDALGSVAPEVIRLPAKVALFSRRELNRFALLHKALVAGSVLRLALRYPGSNISFVKRAEAIEMAQDLIREDLIQHFPRYDEWSKFYLGEIQKQLIRMKLPAEDLAWLRKSRLIERLPSVVFAPWVELMPPKDLLVLPCAGSPPKSRLGKKSELEGQGATGAEYVELNKQKAQDNPVSHSFEKLETAEEYRGGFRAADGSDQLQDHARALEELKLDRVTRDGESAASQYSADLTGAFESSEGQAETAHSGTHVLLPEWDFKKRALKPDFCRLYTRKFSADGAGEAWVAGLREEHALVLARWQTQITGLVNQRKWIDRQLDGSDFSVDAAIRYFAEVRHGGGADPRLYMRERLAWRDYAVLILLDQSLSTDSWVANRRVLDVELESIGLIGCLLKDLREPVAVAGTWSETRNNCQFVTYKDFREDWSSFFNSVSGIVPNGYTRLGPAIRYGTALLAKTGARKKLMIILTDGKPTDYDRYEGRYGIEDIHHAFLEAKQSRVTIRALAIENQARHYFPHLFGRSGYSVLNDPSELPGQLFDIFLRTRGSH